MLQQAAAPFCHLPVEMATLTSHEIILRLNLSRGTTFTFLSPKKGNPGELLAKPAIGIFRMRLKVMHL